jgi:glycosyltransferase involved in cell wall biosynthesis
MTAAPAPPPLRIALVLWGGYIGGAESLTADLAREIRKQGGDAGIVFVLDGQPLSNRLRAAGVPCTSLRLPRGRSVLRAPCRLARAVTEIGADVAVLIESGFLAAALRIGGYRRPIIGVEHGAVLQLDRLPPAKRFRWAMDRASGRWACSVEVAVSEYIRRRLVERVRRARVVCITSGVDLERFRPTPASLRVRTADGDVVIGCAARLVPGKGVDDLIRALAIAPGDGMRLRVAGDGPERPRLESLAHALGVRDRIEFLGPVADMPAFWQSVDVAVVPSHQWIESFGMVAVEAMACGKPVVAARTGALPDLVVDGRTGRLVEGGAIGELANALAEYGRDAALRREHGAQARRRAEDEFGLDRTASQYLDLCAAVARGGRPADTRRGVREAIG